MMEAVRVSETSVYFNETTRLYPKMLSSSTLMYWNITEGKLSGKYLLIEICAILQRNHNLFH
jgi:hypothetical protein